MSNPNRQGGTPRSPALGVIAFTATQDGPRRFGTRGMSTHALNQSAVRSGTPTTGNERSPPALRSLKLRHVDQARQRAALSAGWCGLSTD